MLKQLFLISWLFVVTTSNAQNLDNSQWRGPNRNGIYPEKNLLNVWQKEGPRLLWSNNHIGLGYSSAAVTTDRVYVTGLVEDTGYVFAFDLNGKLLWKTAYGDEWSRSHPGARTTPTIHDGQLFLMSGLGKVVCMDAGKGDLLWSVDLIKKFGARNLKWGMTESLLIDGERVICTPGGPDATVVALNRRNGKTVWITEVNHQKSAYCSPMLIEHGNLRLIITMIGRSIIALNADDGKLLWSHPHITKYDINPNTPIYKDGYLYCVSGYGTGGVKLKLSADGKSVKEIWRNDTLDSQMGAAIIIDGYIYGSGHRNRGWHCLDWETGAVKFSSNELGRKGNIIYADGMLYCYGENGQIGLVKPNPEKFTVVNSFEVPLGENEHWAHPVIRDKRLYVRHGSALMVYSIAK